MREIDHDQLAVLAHFDFRNVFAAEQLLTIYEALVLANRTGAALENRARMKQLGKLLDQLIAHPIGARSEQLEYQQIAVAIDDDAREPIAIAIDQPVAIAVIADYQLSQRQRVAEAPLEKFGNRGRVTPDQHPHRNRGRRAVVAEPEESAGGVMNFDWGAGLDRERFEVLDSAGKNPRIAAAYGGIASALEKNFIHCQFSAVSSQSEAQGFGLAGGSPGRLKSPLRPPLFATSRTASMTIARSIALAMS